ncbi:MAG: ABC transporter permease [Thermoplasmata archaeon]|nr:ABC transporter permease [Thermoplasmata archaeon]
MTTRSAPGGPSSAGGASPARRAWGGFVVFLRVLRANPLTLVGFLLVVLLAGAALVMLTVPHLLTPYSVNQLTLDYNQAPSWHHPFGTDGTGLDIYAMVLYAIPIDLAIAFAIAGAALFWGGALGLVAGFWDKPGTLGGALSVVILRVTDIFLSFPSLILALAIAVSLGRGVPQLILAVLLTWWPFYVRLVRGETLAVKHLPYVMAARAAGVTEGRIVLRHVLRNVVEPVVVYFTLDIGTVLVTLSTIGFIGLGVNYPFTPEWGSMISYYQSAGLISAYPWTVLGPGLAIFLTVLAFSLLGDGLRDVLDPRSRRVLAGTGTGGASSTSPSEREGATAEPSLNRSGLPEPIPTASRGVSSP